MVKRKQPYPKQRPLVPHNCDCHHPRALHSRAHQTTCNLINVINNYPATVNKRGLSSPAVSHSDHLPFATSAVFCCLDHELELQPLLLPDQRLPWLVHEAPRLSQLAFWPPHSRFWPCCATGSLTDGFLTLQLIRRTEQAQKPTLNAIAHKITCASCSLMACFASSSFFLPITLCSAHPGKFDSDTRCHSIL